MQSSTDRLDRFISKITRFTKSDVRYLIAQKRLVVDGELATDIHQPVNKFTEVILDGAVLQNNLPIYIALHKPKGVVSATRDVKHATVLDLLPEAERKGLHIVGRLDFNSTGLVLLTNDGKWSAAINGKNQKVKKFYRVVVDKPITQEMVHRFQQGMYFSYEDLVTAPAELIKMSCYEALVVLTEGRYHQIKRMFGQMQSKVLDLHRYAVGGLILGDELTEGQHKYLTPKEASQVLYGDVSEFQISTES